MTYTTDTMSSRHSTERNDVSGALFFDRLLRSHLKRPDLTFGQLVCASLAHPTGQPIEAAVNLQRMTDEEVAQAIERFVNKPEGSA